MRRFGEVDLCRYAIPLLLVLPYDGDLLRGATGVVEVKKTRDTLCKKKTGK